VYKIIYVEVSRPFLKAISRNCKSVEETGGDMPYTRALICRKYYQ
jgi:hypothetical protein